jgi:hypothetical protein
MGHCLPRSAVFTVLNAADEIGQITRRAGRMRINRHPDRPRRQKVRPFRFGSGVRGPWGTSVRRLAFLRAVGRSLRSAEHTGLVPLRRLAS